MVMGHQAASNLGDDLPVILGNGLKKKKYLSYISVGSPDNG